MNPVIDKNTPKPSYIQGIEDAFEYICCIIDSLPILEKIDLIHAEWAGILPEEVSEKMIFEIEAPFEEFAEKHKLFDETFNNNEYLLEQAECIGEAIQSLIENKLK